MRNSPAAGERARALGVRLARRGPARRRTGPGFRGSGLLRWEEGSNTATFDYTPETMSDRLHLSGRLTAMPLGDGRCRVVLDAEVTVNVFGIAGVVERLVAKDLPLRQEKVMTLFNTNLGSR